MAELADAEDLKSSGAILVGSSPSPGTRQRDMTWLIITLGYLLGSIPTAYIAGRIARGEDIRTVGDRNMGAQNVFRQLGPALGIPVGLIDMAKGILAILLAEAAGLPQIGVLLTGIAAVIGHNWPIFLGFRGGRGEATTIGILYALVTVPALIVTMPALITLWFSRNVTLSSVVAFVPLPFICWWMGISGTLIAYAIILLCVVALTHLLRTRHVIIHQA
jgi:acyl phosphate:glycerol-3-phosphate acyltransferase